MSGPTAHRFLSVLSAEVRTDVAEEELQAMLDTILDNAHQRWPNVEVEDGQFAVYLAERIVDPPVLRSLEQLWTDDLYIACACANRNENALARFAHCYGPGLDAVLASMKIGQAAIDDVKQQLHQKLFVSANGELPRIRDYAGEGELRIWTRVIAVRLALNQLRKGKREVALDDTAMLLLQSPDDSPDLCLLKKRYRGEFKAAFHSAVATLDVRERNLLRMHLLDGLSIDRIGVCYRVHRATAFRWVAKAREKVWVETQRILQSELRLSPSEYRSILTQIRSQLDLSIERALHGDAAV